MLLNHFTVLALGLHAFHFAYERLIAEELYRRRSHYTRRLSDFWVLLNVDFDIVYLPAEFVHDLAENRLQRVARSTGRRGIF